MKKPLHILHFYKSYYTRSFGGVEQMIRHLAIWHVAMGHRVTVLTLSREVTKPTKETHEGITIWYFPLNFELASNGISFSALRHVGELAQAADVLHFHFPWPSGDLLRECVPSSLPTVVTYHSDIVRQKLLKLAYYPLMRRFLSRMDVIAATSPHYIATSPVLRRYKDKTVNIPIGIDETLYPKPTARDLAHWRAECGEGFFLFVGALRYYKGLPTLIEAARATGLPVVIAGAGNQDGGLKKLAEGLGNVRFVGAVNDRDKMALLALCRAFVFPSHLRSEAFGVSLIEAAMCAKPMIACEIGTGTSYINRDGETGIVVPPQDNGAFANAMTLLAGDDALATQYGAAARKRFETYFTAEKMAADYLTVYFKLQTARR